MTSLDIAVIGAGGMGQRHAAAVADSPLCKLVGVVEPDAGRGAAAAKSLGCRHFADLEGLLADARPQAAIVAVPDRLHVDITVDLLNAGVNVLVEKPIADTVEGAQRMRAAAEASGSRLAVAHILRHDARYIGAAEAVAAGELGETVHVRASRLVPRSVGVANHGASPIWMYQGPHDIDLIQWIGGRRITALQALTTQKILASMDQPGVDAAFILAQLEGGAIAALELGWAFLDSDPSGLRAEFEIVGTDGSARVMVADQGLSILNKTGFRLPDTMHWPTPYGHTAGDLSAQLTEFASALSNDRPFIVPLDAAISVVAVIAAIGRAVESGGSVEVADVSRAAGSAAH